MTLLLSLIYWETVTFLFCVFGIVVASLIDSSIGLDGLFCGIKGDGSKYFSPERVQLFAFTLAVAFQFLSAVLRDPSRFPDVPASWLATFGGSHVLYLGGKSVAAFLGKK